MLFLSTLAFHKAQGGPPIKSLSVKREDDIVVHNIENVLEVWQAYFSKFGCFQILSKR